MSILSFPNRGHWGNSSWRGNCSGHVYKEMFNRLQPQTFCDPMAGSGTAIEVAQEMGIQAWGFDLHSGFNVLNDSLVQAIGQEVDLSISHPPYGSMIRYSRDVWNKGQPVSGDLSEMGDDDLFIGLFAFEGCIVT